MGLWDMVLVKENHIVAAGGIRAALERVAQENRAGLPVEVEVTSLEELEEALPFEPERILLDNMSAELMEKAVTRVRDLKSRPELEASGNVTLETVRRVAETGVDLISVGALTHSAPAADLSMRLGPDS
jgi:nicotinate-nucleotide pyrophosphorylase (carboxylating)